MVRQDTDTGDEVRLSTRDWLGIISFLLLQLISASVFFGALYNGMDSRLTTVEANQLRIIKVVDRIEDERFNGSKP